MANKTKTGDDFLLQTKCGLGIVCECMCEQLIYGDSCGEATFYHPDDNNRYDTHKKALLAAVELGLIPYYKAYPYLYGTRRKGMARFNVLSTLDDVIDVLESGASPEDYCDANIVEKLIEIRGYVAGILVGIKEKP